MVQKLLNFVPGVKLHLFSKFEAKEIGRWTEKDGCLAMLRSFPRLASIIVGLDSSPSVDIQDKMLVELKQCHL